MACAQLEAERIATMSHTDDVLGTLAGIGWDAARQREQSRDAQPRQTEDRPRVTVSGVVADADGLCGWQLCSASTLPDGTLRASKQSVWREDPSADYANEQPSAIPILLDHDRTRRIGEVVHLERRHGKLFAVGLLDLEYEAVEGMELRWSSGTDGTKRPFRITELSLTSNPASVALPAVAFRPGELSHAITYPGNRELLNRAITTRKRRAKGDPIWIDDPELPDIAAAGVGVLLERSATVDHISTAQRLVELVAVPYDVEAKVYWRGQWWTEVFQYGAFTDFIRSGVLPRVNREHTKGDTVGKILDLRESPEGLIATIKVASTLRGDETLSLAKEDMISSSIGFSFLPGGRILDEARRYIRVIRAQLDHLSLVEAPAYEGAKVLSVRNCAQVAAP
jgi:HK97 family phage prohead protease